MQHIFLSHDVDWPRQGPSLEHVLARKERFDAKAIKEAERNRKNIYYNLPEIMDIEEGFGIRSTFFYRTMYENGSFEDYEDDIHSLIDGGWEIGLHSDPSSIHDTEKLQREKRLLEDIAKDTLKGNRVHYLAFDDKLTQKLAEIGFVYDSTVRNSKDKIDKTEMGYKKTADIIEFPLTLMDAYLFTYMKLSENNVISAFDSALKIGRELDNDFNVITVNWHDNILQMKGGRMYKKILEFLSSQDDVEILRGIDVANLIREKDVF